VTVSFDYVSTLADLETKPLRPASNPVPRPPAEDPEDEE
jgi:hypothetical protein